MYSNLTTIEFSSLIGFPKPGNDTMESIVHLLSEMTILMAFIFLGVLLVLANTIDVYNAETNPTTRHFEKSVEATLDVLFVIFPTTIIIYLLIPALGYIFNNEILVETFLTLDVIGHQWYWSYEYNYFLNNESLFCEYPELVKTHKIEFDSILDQESTFNRLLQVDKRVIIPVNCFIEVKITSQDVIHSWAVPQLGIKYDAIPGRIITFILSSSIEGVFYGQCSELCGVNHAFMPICVQAVDFEIFRDWMLITLNLNPSLNFLNLMILDEYFK